jgi:membrane fusion protein, heavy metal efflux system
VEDRLLNAARRRTKAPSLRAGQRRDSARGRQGGSPHGRNFGPVAFGTPPVLGTKIEAGQVLAEIAPRLAAADRGSLDAEVLATRAELEGAEAQLGRAERLFAEKAIPERALEEAKTRTNVARARLNAASSRLAQFRAGASGSVGRGAGGFQVRAPFAGTLVQADVTAGEVVEEGKLLFTIIDLDRVWLEARVFEPDIPKIERTRGAWFVIEGHDVPFVVDESTGRLITIGHVIDPMTRTVPVIFEVANREGRLRIGQFAKVGIFSGDPVEALAIPESAIVEDAGKQIAFVQVEGEAFERRTVSLGIRDQGWVEVKEGLAAKERVVTVGAYEIRLASASGTIPAHGHAH